MEFGSNMAISDDGTRIAVGALANEASGTNVEQEGGGHFMIGRTAIISLVAGDGTQPTALLPCPQTVNYLLLMFLPATTECIKSILH